MEGLVMRPMEPRDNAEVLELVNADRIPGQPSATVEGLREAAAGRSPVDGGWWEELDHPIGIDVAEGSAEDLVGVVSYAMRPKDQAGLILWLHGREDPQVVGQLIDHALAQMPQARLVEAFVIASALGLGLEALPVGHRPVTAKALAMRGFVAEDLWRYMRRDLPAAGLGRAEQVTVIDADRPGRKLEMCDADGAVIAEAQVGAPVAGVGVLWWIEVQPKARGRGLGRRLLGSALEALVEMGAEEVILYVDDDQPGTARDRTAANQMYEGTGFVEVDRLHSFRLDR